MARTAKLFRVAAVTTAVIVAASWTLPAAADVIRIEFNNLPYPTGHNVTNEWETEGIIFSDDDNGMDPNFPCQSLGWQENRVQSQLLWNLFRINFVHAQPVIDVVCEFRDQNGNPQIHGLYELDANLNIVQSVTYDDANGAEFSLHLANPNGIFGIAACEQPYGAQLFNAIEFTTAGVCVGDLDGDGDTDLADLGILLADFGCTTPPGPCGGDLDGDGDTDLADLGILLADFGCEP